MSTKSVRGTNPKARLKENLDEANRAVDLVFKELSEIHREHLGLVDDLEFIKWLSYSKKSGRSLRQEINNYRTLTRNERFAFTEIAHERKNCIGKAKEVDLIISRHLSDETLERYVVFKAMLKCPPEPMTYLDVEAWCRLYYVPSTDKWYVHYVDLIIRGRNKRILFMFEREEKTDELKRAVMTRPDVLCKFFMSSQGGTWG